MRDVVREAEEPHVAGRVVEAVLETLRRVRRDPALAGWFAPDDVGIASVLAQSSAVIEEMVAAFLGEFTASHKSLPPSPGNTSACHEPIQRPAPRTQ